MRDPLHLAYALQITAISQRALRGQVRTVEVPQSQVTDWQEAVRKQSFVARKNVGELEFNRR